MPRRRMTPEQRRAQLLDAGLGLFGEQPYEAVSMADVAAAAGVSRALAYHYFPTKPALFAAVYQRAADRLLTEVRLDADRPFADQVRDGLEAHIDFFVANPRLVLTANRGELATDPVVQGIISGELAELRSRMLDASGLTGHARELASAGLHAWLAFVRALCVEWLHYHQITRSELRETCLRALHSTLNLDAER